jgi:hypothetical protein
MDPILILCIVEKGHIESVAWQPNSHKGMRALRRQAKAIMRAIPDWSPSTHEVQIFYSPEPGRLSAGKMIAKTDQANTR